MSDDPAAPGENTPVDQLEKERQAQILGRLHDGVWPVVTLAVLSLAVVLSIARWLDPDNFPTTVYSSGYDLWFGHQWLGLFGAIFIHGNALHLIFNCYWFWLFGRVLEVELGSVKYSLLLLGAAWVGGTAELAVSGNPGIGLSGVVYAYFGYMLVNRKKFAVFSFVLPGRTVQVMLVWLVVCVALHYSGAMAIANGAHFAGFAAGYCVGYFHGQPIYRTLLVSIILVLGLSVPVVWAPWQEGWCASKAQSDLEAEKLPEARLYIDQVLSKNPKNTWAHLMKAYVENSLGHYAVAKDSYLAAVALSPEDPQTTNGLAWLLATCPDDAVRDGEAAVKHARKACELAAWKSAACIDTYAAGLAEKGDFAEAVTWQEKALAVASEEKAVYEEHLKSFKAGKPWRELKPEPVSPSKK